MNVNSMQRTVRLRGHARLQPRELRECAALGVRKKLIQMVNVCHILGQMHVGKRPNGPQIVLIVGANGAIVASKQVKVALLRPARAIIIGDHSHRGARHGLRKVSH